MSLGALLGACGGRGPQGRDDGRRHGDRAQDDAVSDRVLGDEAYRGRGQRTRRNESDGISDPSLGLSVERSGDGYLGLMYVDVARA